MPDTRRRIRVEVMPHRGSFERRLLVALVLFSVVPSLLLIGLGTALLWQALELHASPEAWVQLRRSGSDLLRLAADSGDPALVRAAADHRSSLDFALHQSRLWDYLDSRLLQLIPALAILIAAILVWLAFRSARGIARELARPIEELVGWARLVAREEPLPERTEGEASSGDFATLRDALRSMAGELALSRARALEEERARAWVVMARGVAHELKNSLTPLRLAARALERETAGNPTAREPVEVLTSESLRLEELARSFAQFGHLPEGPASEIDLRELFDYLLRTHLPPDIRFRLRAPVGLPHLEGHHDMLSRAFANLLLNAAEAMSDGGGTITVVLSAQHDALEVRILDSGPGIPEADLERIWAPDFTTKSRGTGLGLALVRQSIHAHGGRIWAHNRAEGGAEMRVLLPREPARGAKSP